ncbi:ABC transporter permease [Actinomarinicola tropica]|uniref:ABC transporter permease n=1 Tax=Actinomarinicola tropica TaxID=2789776 RepID=A0A5Q2RGT2_9ACTN|nr:ABC transporter permease [Actinomarinicola tropica]QGG96039.1 ABC transporter permease [Actinomarinicola tropica]
MIRRIGLGIAAPVVAVLFSLLLSSLFLVLADASPIEAYRQMWDYGTRSDSVISMINRAVPLYISGLAVAFGMKMGLLNIGVEGQYRIAAVAAAAVGSAVVLPAPLHVALILVVAVLAGMAWITVPTVLKVTRGVHEVISTIMMNAISIGLTAWLLQNFLDEKTSANDLELATKDIPASGRFPSLNPVLEWLGLELRTGSDLHGFVVIAALLGIAYYIVIWRTRFGFDLRASGANSSAALVSGVQPKAMVAKTLLISGGLAGLVGMSQMLGFFYRFTVDFPQQLGFTGIAVALLGRNHPAGIAIGALLFGFMERSAQILDLEGIPKEIVVIMQGIIVISVVVAYELVRRIKVVQDQKAVARQEPAAAGASAEGVPA